MRCICAFALLSLAALACDLAASAEEKGEIAVIEQTYKDYLVRITGPTDYRATLMESTLEIYKGDEQVFKMNEWRFYFGHLHADQHPNDLIKIGTDITGNEKPNLVVSSWSGGAHCCHSYYIFELANTFRHLDTIDVLDNGSAHFEDRDGDANLEFVMADYTFAYWNECFAESPAPRVVLRFKDDGYHIAEDLMRAPAPSASDIQERAVEIAAHPRWTEGRPPTKLWDIMLKWIYSGNDDAAGALLDQAWPPDLPGKEEFRGAFKEQLAKSQWWPEIKAMCDRTKDEKRP